MASDLNARPDHPGFTSETMAVKKDFSETLPVLETFQLGDLTVEASPGRDTLWIVVRRPGEGAIALRTNPWPGPYDLKFIEKTNISALWENEASVGKWTIELSFHDDRVLQIKVTLVPAVDLLLNFWPRDVFVLDKEDNPLPARGRVEAAQRGVNGGVCYFCLEEPLFGNVLYAQNLTALNPYYLQTKTKPDGVVGGEWPELGYQPPTGPMANNPPVHPLKKGHEVVVSDALLTFSTGCADSEIDSARKFIEMLATVYPYLSRPEPKFHDWRKRAKQTVKDLETSPDATIKHYGHTYLHPYVAAEYPDSMVQMTVLSTLREYELNWGPQSSLGDNLQEGIGRFYDDKLQTIRRYLPNVGDDKNASAVDSWYLYHPLMNLARLAKGGDKKAETIFRDSLDFAVKAARHFKYKWPIQYDITDFSVITDARKPDGLGQTDVGGIYAYVMLQAWDLTGDDQYLEEAKAALHTLKNERFELAYQTNLTAWGAVACLKLWVLDKSSDYMDQSLAFIASFLHNCELWDSEIGFASKYTNFFGVTCLHDAPYMAAYECFEAFAAFDEYLRVGGEEILPAVKLLLSEFRRYALDFTWYFYPDALPDEVIAKDNIRNGHIDRKLSFPLEDLYGDGQPAGQVGQEIYGCGGAFIFASRAFYKCGDAPFTIFADYPIDVTPVDAGSAEIRVLGPAPMKGRFRLLQQGRAGLPRIHIVDKDTGGTVTARERGEDFRDYEVPADGRLVLTWS
ncbi:hypothetical protein [Asticcacaulis taihuensis]|uniref:hypothetical protein n=1 Tax=Asticcacaulis taihuensis TaxID=260084 RepID=UPI0026ED481B|nr:hypothetical protein [Asticcacaulis taihuensis]